MTSPIFRHRGPAAGLKDQDLLSLVRRLPDADDVVRDIAAATIDTVRFEGDTALRSLARDYDGVDLKSLEVDRTQLTAAVAGLPNDQRAALEMAVGFAEQLFTQHVPQAYDVEPIPGHVITYRPEAYDSVGVYAPGIRTPWPSSVIATVVPARMAGVREIVVCSPPQKRTGRPDSLVLAASALAGATRVFAIGGAGAMAAMAHGTQSVPRVDKLFGAGNPYAVAAKGLLGSALSSNAPAVANECVFIVDESADAAQVARELVAQAEVDERACVIVLALGDTIAELIEASLVMQLGATERSSTARAALSEHGALLSLNTVEQAVAFTSAFAPAMAVVATRNAPKVAANLRQVGSIHVGLQSSPAIEDCLTGLSASAPSAGLARSYSVLHSAEFFRWTAVHRVAAVHPGMVDAAHVLADVQGLDAHARAAAALRQSGA